MNADLQKGWVQTAHDTFQTVLGERLYVIRQNPTGWSVFVMGTFEGADPFFAHPLAHRDNLDDAQRLAERHHRNTIKLENERNRRIQKLEQVDNFPAIIF